LGMESGERDALDSFGSSDFSLQITNKNCNREFINVLKWAIFDKVFLKTMDHFFNNDHTNFKGLQFYRIMFR
jgi:hypothetical protein